MVFCHLAIVSAEFQALREALVLAAQNRPFQQHQSLTQYSPDQPGHVSVAPHGQVRTQRPKACSCCGETGAWN